MNESCKEIINKIATLKKLWPFLRADFFAFPPCTFIRDIRVYNYDKEEPDGKFYKKKNSEIDHVISVFHSLYSLFNIFCKPCSGKCERLLQERNRFKGPIEKVQ